MYVKLIIAFYAMGFAHAGRFYRAATLAYATAPVDARAYADPAAAAYPAPVVTKTVVSPAMSSISSYYTHQSLASPMANFVAAPVVTNTYAAPAYRVYRAYSAPAYSAYASPTYSAFPAPAYSAYAAPAYNADSVSTVAPHSAPIDPYNAAGPVVSHIGYSRRHGAWYGW